MNIVGQIIPPKKNTVLFYVFSDGTVQKRIILE